MKIIRWCLPVLLRYDAENDLQKLHDKYIKQLENLMDEKEKEIMTV